MMEAHYIGKFLGGSTYPTVPDFISNFYQVSDDQEKNEEWLDFFEPEGTVVMGMKEGQGRDSMREIRLGMWETVARRRHTIAKVFPAEFSGEAGILDYMLYGTVDLVSKTGEESRIDWAGHGRIRKDVEGRWRFVYYRVYLQI